MANTQQAVRLTAQLYEIRDAARTFLGAKFDSRMKEYGAAIREVAECRGQTDLQAATAICAAHNDGHITLFVMAAFVEMTEPTDTRTAGDGEVRS